MIMPDVKSDIIDEFATSRKLGEEIGLTGRAFHEPTS